MIGHPVNFGAPANDDHVEGRDTPEARDDDSVAEADSDQRSR